MNADGAGVNAADISVAGWYVCMFFAANLQNGAENEKSDRGVLC
jgi:hypothetical protein